MERVGVIRYGVLGPVAAWVERRSVRIGSSNQRTLLATLVLDAGQTVPSDRLVEILWGDVLPADPAGALRTQVARLRRLLGPASSDLVTEPRGYRLAVETHEIDAGCFEALLRAAADPAEHAAALAAVEEALGLWRGPFDHPGAEAAGARLEEMRAAAHERRADLLLELGRTGDAVAALEALLMAQPERERARGLLMEALYREGRHADALSVYESWRHSLAEELGLDPSPELQRLHLSVLRHEVADRSVAGGVQRALPMPTTTFLGRAPLLDVVVGEFANTRVLTLTGPGGVGKTRLALEAAAQVIDGYQHGGRFCDLAAIGHSNEVVRAVAATLELQEFGSRRLEDQVVQHLSGRRLLLVLDNCEHVRQGAAALAERIVQHTSGVDVLATSRERLGVDGERVLAVPVLAPDAAAQLFLDRFGALEPGLALDEDDRQRVRDICADLDGLPLAVELAAARLPGLTVAALGNALADRFGVLSHGRRTVDRHRSLRAVVDWSYDLLLDEERDIFDRLSVFASAFDLDAVVAVAADGGRTRALQALVGLVDRSLVNQRRNGPDSSYTMLETLRMYGRERLRDQGRLDEQRDQHAAWVLEFVEAAAEGLAGPDEPRWASRLRRHYDDVRVAHNWMVGRDIDNALRLSAALDTFAIGRTHSEIFRWAEVAAGAASGGRPHLPAVMGSAAIGALRRADFSTGEALAKSAVEAARRTGPTHQATSAMAEVALLRGDVNRAHDLFVEAARLAEEKDAVLHAVWNLGGAALSRSYGGDHRQAAVISGAAGALADERGGPSARSFASFVDAETISSTDPEGAQRQLLVAIELATSVESSFVRGIAEVALAALLARHSDTDTARSHYARALTEWRDTATWTPLWVTLRTLADLLSRLGANTEAAVLMGAIEVAPTVAPFGADAAMLDQLRTRLESSLGPRRFDELLAAGAELNGDQVIEAALEALGRPAG